MSVLQDARHISLAKGIEEYGDGVMSLKMPFDKKIGGEKDGGIISAQAFVWSITSFRSIFAGTHSNLEQPLCLGGVNK